MHFKTVIPLVVTICALAVQASSINLPVTQDFATTNYGYGEAQITRPDTLSFYNNGFQSSIVYFGIDLSPLAVIDESTISSVTLSFTNFTVIRDASASIAITLLNYGQLFDENTVSINTQPTSQGKLGKITFDSTSKAASLDITAKFMGALSAGGLFGFRVDPPGGPVSVASHRVNADSVQLHVTIGANPTTRAPATTIGPPASPPTDDGTTAIPAATTTSTPTTTGPATTKPTTAPTTTSKATQTTKPASTTRAPTTRAPTTRSPQTTKPGSTSAPTTTTTSSPTSSYSPAPDSPAPTQVPATEQARSNANNVQFALLCLVPLIFVL